MIEAISGREDFERSTYIVPLFLPQPIQTVEEPLPEYKRELTEEKQLEAILNDPLLADIEDSADLGLFDVPEYMRQRLEARKEAEYIGKRRPCEDFDKSIYGIAMLLRACLQEVDYWLRRRQVSLGNRL